MHANIQAEIATALLAKTLTDTKTLSERDSRVQSSRERRLQMVLTDEQNHQVDRVHSKADQKI